MSGIQMNSSWGRAAAAGGLGALLVTVGCGGALNGGGVNAQHSPPLSRAHRSSSAANRTSGRSCGRRWSTAWRCRRSSACRPDSRVAYAQQQPAQPTAAPVSYRAPRAIESPRDPELADARVIPVSYPAATARPVRTNQIVYGDDRMEPVKRSRSVKKSAVIIGSSAGVGAAVGAAVKGKKGASSARRSAGAARRSGIRSRDARTSKGYVRTRPRDERQGRDNRVLVSDQHPVFFDD